MREMKDSGIEWINYYPSNWDIKRIKNVLIERNETNNPIKTDFILSLTNDRGVIPYEEKGDVGNKSKDDLTGYKLACPDDIVLNSMNVFIGSVALSNYSGCVSPVYYMLYKRNDNDDIRFYNYLFQTKQLQTKLHGYGNGIMDIRMRIQMSKLNTVMIPVAPSNEQQRIADYLDDKCGKIDTIIEKQEQIIEKLKEYKSSLLDELIGHNHVGTSCHIGFLGAMKNGLNFSDTLNGNTIKFLGVGDFKDYYFLDSPDCFSAIPLSEEISDDYYLKDEDIVFVRSNGSKDLVGRAVMVQNIKYPLTYSGFCIRFRNMRKDILDSRYLLYFFRTPHFRKLLEKYSYGSNISNMNQDLLSQITICFPDLLTQKRIVDILNRETAIIDGIIEKKQEITDKILQYKQSLIYEVVTGKKEV